MMAFWIKCQNILSFCPLFDVSENANNIIFQHINLAHVGLLLRWRPLRTYAEISGFLDPTPLQPSKQVLYNFAY